MSMHSQLREAGFVPGYINREGQTTEIHNLDGVPWHEAPIPRRFHRCRPQTMGLIGFTWIARCACGALRYEDSPDSPWLDRNARRRARQHSRSA